MSTIEHTESAVVGKIPIGRRISELMQERGDAFSIRAFAPRIGMNRETFRLILTGERPITLSTLEKVVEQLGVTEERLRQRDTYKKEQELLSLLQSNTRTKTMLIYAETLAKQLAEVAIGFTERGYALNNLGKVQFLQENYDGAHETWKSALVYAKQLKDLYNDTHIFYLVTANLMLTSTIRREFSNIESILSEVEQVFRDNPQVLGIGYYTRMKVQENCGNLELAREYAYRSLEYFELTQNGNHIGKALMNVAHYEFVLGNYRKSVELLSAAIEHVKSYEDVLVDVVKNYVKSLIKIKDYATAARMIEEYHDVAKEYPEYWARLQILYTVAKDDPSFAEGVVNNASLSRVVRYIASKCLMEFYYLKDDAQNAMRYYEKVRLHSRHTSDYLEEEEL